MAGRKQKKLDPRKSIFISEILSGKSGALAARAAGVEKKNAARQAHRWQKDPGVSEEIEKGLAAIREGAEVDVQSMIRQLDADRQFAIKTENASAATRASELKAKLCGLMIDRRDTRATVTADLSGHSTRAVGLAIMAVLQDGDIDPAEALESIGGKDKRGEHSPLEDSQSIESTPPAEKEWSNDEEKIGEQIPIGDKGAKIVPVEVEHSGEKKYAVYDSRDELHRIHLKRSDAEAHALNVPGPSLEPENGVEK